MRRRRFRLTAGVLLGLGAASAPAAAQVPLAPRSLGMAGAVVGGARGHDALFVNPANLGLPGNPRWSVAVPQVTLGGTLAGPALGDLPDLVRPNDLSDARRDEIFGTIPGAGAAARFDLRAPLFAFQRDGIAVGVAYGATGDQRLSRDAVELALYGYEQGRLDYDVAGTEGSRLSFWDVAVAYGSRIGGVSWGVTGHYLRGGSLARTWAGDPRVNLAATDIDVDMVTVLSRGGNGFALDVGAAYQPHTSVTLSGAVANAFATMSWSDELRVRSLRLTRTDLDAVDPVDLYDRYAQSERSVGPADAALTRGLTAAELQRGAYLPTTLRLGVGWQALPRTHLGVSYFGNVTGGRLHGGWDRMLGVGVQQRIPLLLLRAGYATNLTEGSMLSGGVSLGPLEVGVARLEDGTFDTAPRSGWMGALGFAARTRSVRR